jgi:hypothetical protein
MEQQERIPRIIHYCWFGRGEKSKKIRTCMKSWEKKLGGGYQFMEWNEDSFNLDCSKYAKEAYKAKKYAFVSDYVRLYALYHHGGIYLDTDVEVLKALDPLLLHDAFSGFEDGRFLQSGTMGAAPKHPWIKKLLDDYEGRTFLLPDGTYDMMTNTAVISGLCKSDGLVLDGTYQRLRNGVVMYPREYFSPYDYINGGSYRTEDSYTIHHFAQSWLPVHVRFKSGAKRVASRIIGPKAIAKVRKLFA